MSWGVLLGTALQLWQAQLWEPMAYAGVAVAGLALALASSKIGTLGLRFVGLGLAFVLLAFAQTGWRAAVFQQGQLNPALEGQTLQLQGVISALPDREAGHWRFQFEVEEGPIGVPQRILLSWYDAEEASQRLPELKVGQRWRLSVRLKAPHGSVNPHGFDVELWMWQQGLQASGYVRHNAHDPVPQWLAQTQRYPVQSLRQRVRDAIDLHIADRAVAGIVSALTLGDQAAIESSDWQIFRITGVAHLMAISGLHITGLAWLVAGCMGWIWRHSDAWQPERPWALRCPAVYVSYIAACGTALLYAIFTGWGVPAQRTVGMLLLFTWLRWHDKRWPWFYSWSWVAAWVVVLDPWALLEAGFWLSFVAVALLFASGRDVLPARLPSLARYAWFMFKEQWLMSVCLAPLALVLFHQVSLIGFVANLLAVPWITLFVTPLCLLGLLFPAAWSMAAWGVQSFRTLLWTLSAWPYAQWSSAAAPLWVGVMAILGCAVWALRVPLWIRCLGLLWALPLLTWQAPRPEYGEFDLLAADMGQGHAVLLRTAQQGLLYDTGPRYSAQSDAGQRVLVPLLQSLGERLTGLFISHQDADHSGGLAAVLAMQPQVQIWTSMPETHPLRALRVMQTCQAGQRWQWDGVDFQVLHPLREDYARQSKANALSCVLRVQSASGRIALLVGDIEAAQELALLRRESNLSADWLLVPHHGSATSSTSDFLQAVRPRVAVVQAGYRNRFGHPRPEVVARYDALAVRLVQTPQCGAAYWQSLQPELVQCEREVQKNYWNPAF
jgi:competence protein ComEC